MAKRPERKTTRWQLWRGPGLCIAWARAREWSGAVVEPRGLVYCSSSRVFWEGWTINAIRSETKLSTCELAGLRGFKSAFGSVPGLPSARGVALFAELRRDADATMRATRGLSETAAAPTRLFSPDRAQAALVSDVSVEPQVLFAVCSPVA